MPQTIHLHDIRIDSQINPHDDLPSDMQMFAQLIIDKHIFLQTVPVDSEASQNAWKLDLGCKIPDPASTFFIVIMRRIKKRGNRVLGYVEIGRGKALMSGEEKTVLSLELMKVNLDGPSLELKAVFSTTETSAFKPLILEPDVHRGINIQANQIILDIQTLMSCLVQMGDSTNEIHSLDLSVMHERILLLSNGNTNRSRFLYHLGSVCFKQWGRYPIAYNLNHAVCAYEDAVRDDCTNPIYLADLGIALITRFQQLGDLSDLNNSVSIQEAAIALTPDGNPNKLSILSNLGSSLDIRFERVGDLRDLNKSVALNEDAVRLTPNGHPDKPTRLTNLGNSLIRRFQRLGDLGDLNKAITLNEDAARWTPDGHPDKSSMLNNLGSSFMIRFERLGDLGDLHKSVAFKEDAVRLIPDGHPDKPGRLTNLGNALIHRFEGFGDLSDLSKSVALQEDAVKLTPDEHPYKPVRLTNLGGSLMRQFERLGNIDDLHKSVAVKEDAVQLTPDGHPEKPSILTYLGCSLMIHFEQLGDLHDLNKAVALQEDAVKLTPYEHPDKPGRLADLGSSLMRRFERLGDLGDINRSVALKDDAVRLTLDGHAEKPSRLNNLGQSLTIRFERLGDLDDLNKSVAVKEDAVRLTPDGHSDKPGRLKNLGNSLTRRFELLGDPGDINKSVVSKEEAVRLTPDGHPEKPSRLTNLGISLIRRFQCLGDLSDLNQSVALQEDAVDLTPAGHSDKPGMLSNLGDCLITRFEHLGDASDLGHSVRCFKSAANSNTGSASIRFSAASKWAAMTPLEVDPSPLDAYTVALGILPELAWLGLSITDRHHHIMKAGSLVRNAAAAAISAGQFETAVDWLEQGRSIIWGQLLNLHTPVDALQKKHPMFAAELIALSAQLEGGGTRKIHSGVIDSGSKESLQVISQKAHENAHKRAQLLKEIRELEGFDRFLLPKSICQLSHAAQEGPVVFLNVSSSSCDALALVPGLENQVIHVALIEFTSEHAETLAQSFEYLVPSSGRNDRLFAAQEGSLPPEDEFAHILSELWLRLVKPVLDALAIMTPSKDHPQRIWWCPSGPLTFLPIHAAGLYGKDEAFGSRLSDFVISSYTPSLAALLEGFRPHSKSEKEAQLLAVAQPSASGQLYIPGTREEIDRIQFLAKEKLPVLRFDEHEATVASVQAGMKTSSWVHFACHGFQDASNPTESALLVAGRERLTLSSIINLSLPNADFAFLSACQTATGDNKLQEESVHLAASMLLAGYRGIVATMWSIMDNDAPQVAGNVYEHLFKTSPPDPTRAAEALHFAVRKLCEESGGKKSFFHWVPYIHVGV